MQGRTLHITMIYVEPHLGVCFFFNDTATTEIYTLSLHVALPILDCWRKMRKFDLSLRSSRSSYFATFRHQLTILSKTDALDEEKWLNMLGTFVKDWFRYESHFVHGRDSLVRSEERFSRNAETDLVCRLLLEKKKTWAVVCRCRRRQGQ